LSNKRNILKTFSLRAGRRYRSPKRNQQTAMMTMMLAPPPLRGGGFRRCCVSAWSANHQKHYHQHHHHHQYHHLAILNVAQQRADLSDPIMAEFVAATPHINALAKASPGFVWSYDNNNDNDDGDDPSVGSLLLFRRDDIAELRDDPFLMPQLSVWENVDSLKRFAFQSAHVRYYKRRHEWFTAHLPKPYTVLYHCAAGEENNENDDHHLSPAVVVPPPTTLVEAFSRLRYLKEHGPTEHAFTFATAAQFVIRTTP
jgi:Domain of unknown function (DUF3291)